MILKHDNLQKMISHAEEAYPSECCGIVAGNNNGEKESVYLCKNIQDELHKLDPKTYTRDSRTAYSISPKEYMAILKDVEDNGWVLKFFYHSHPEHPAYFSREDYIIALTGGDEPSYPDMGYLVFSVYAGKTTDYKCFQWNKEKKAFLEIKVTLLSNIP